jgi:hypothetical protein
VDVQPDASERALEEVEAAGAHLARSEELLRDRSRA